MSFRLPLLPLSTRRTALALLMGLALAGCAQRPPVAEGEQWPLVLRTVLPAEVLLLGEQHDDPEHQRMQHAAVQWLAIRNQLGAVVLEMYEHLVEDRTTEPTFYKDFPNSVSPLTRPHRSIPGVAERWDLVAWGVELGTAYSELTDPVEQRRRLQEQSLLAAGGQVQMTAVGEETGALSTLLNQVADFYEKEAGYAVESLTTLIEPAIIMILGLVVGTIVAAIALPMFDMGALAVK